MGRLRGAVRPLQPQCEYQDVGPPSVLELELQRARAGVGCRVQDMLVQALARCAEGGAVSSAGKVVQRHLGAPRGERLSRVQVKCQQREAE